MKVLFLGGGTGGHIAPGIGVAERLARDGAESLFVVAGREVETAMLEPRRLPFRCLFGPGSRPRMGALHQWSGAVRRWRTVLREEDPDVVVVTGGWVALPAALAGFGRRPSVLIEPNARPGKVQRLLSRRVDHVCLAREGPGMPRGRRTTRVTGVPGPELERWGREAAAASFGLDPSRQTLLVMGGSQGAADLNALLPDLCGVLAGDGGSWQVLNITGAGEQGVARVPEGVPVLRVPFVTRMAAAWALADVVVCRSGAGTVSEVAASGTPAVFVPYPHHGDRHQELNARPLVEAGAALCVAPSDPLGRQAHRLLAQVLDQREAMALAARRQTRPEASRLVAAIVGAAAKERHGQEAATVAAGGGSP